jgi:hypothetical protein
VVLVKVYVSVANRPPKLCPVRLSRSVHVVPSSEPWTVKSLGSRVGASFAEVSEYFVTASGVASR